MDIRTDGSQSAGLKLPDQDTPAALSQATDPDVEAHIGTYRKFVRFASVAACAAPFFFAFVLYWTQ